MKSLLTPHTTRWFETLRRLNPSQAHHTREILKLAHSKHVCSLCGAEPEGDYFLGRALLWTIRLCTTCCKLHKLLGLKLRKVARAA